MKQCGYRLSIVLTVGLVLAFTVPVHAQIFSENFNGYAGTQNNTQSDTGKPVAHSGSVAGWTSTGLNDLHAVSNAPNDWVIMFIQDNVMTLFDGQDANDSGTTYRVEFDYGTAVYGNLNGKTEAADSLLIEVLRTDNPVLASTNVAAGTWGAGNYNLDGGLSASFD